MAIRVYRLHLVTNTFNPDDDMENTHVKDKHSLFRHLPLAVILFTAFTGFFTLGDYLSFETLRDNREALLAYRDANLLGLAAVFVVVYFLIVAFSLPGAAIASLTSGFLFGLPLGTAFSVMAASLGAMAIFLAARWGLGEMLSSKLETSSGPLQKINRGLHENEISVLFLIRLVPAVPFFVANLLPALVGVKFTNFAITTILGIIPGAIVYNWIGVGLGEVFDRGASPDLSLLWEPQVIGPIIGLCVLAALPMVIKLVRGKKDI